MSRMEEMALGREIGEQQSLRPRLSFHLALPEHHSESLGSCASCSCPSRSHTSPLFTFNLAVLAEMGLVTQEGLAENYLN